MRIGDAAAAVGATPRALRFYEQRGLLPPPRRTRAGQRDYTPDDLAVLRGIRHLLALGLTVEDLAGIADRLPLLAAHEPRRCRPPAPGEPAIVGTTVVRRRIAVLDAEIDRLTRLRDTLRAGLDPTPRHMTADGHTAVGARPTP
ncbi:MerR family transcriptional regulator [Streptomyces sp. NPDC003247]|uniref:helix-turn-helix domain-containing protein n=1 Tax=Streptomyces sp. NPDC003247 TaxID=3364677 RepID=UPI003696D3C9